jgi:hypothetical protein
MNTILWIIVLLVVLAIVWAVAKFILKLAARTIGCVVTAILAIGILLILIFFVLP